MLILISAIYFPFLKFFFINLQFNCVYLLIINFHSLDCLAWLCLLTDCLLFSDEFCLCVQYTQSVSVFGGRKRDEGKKNKNITSTWGVLVAVVIIGLYFFLMENNIILQNDPRKIALLSVHSSCS